MNKQMAPAYDAQSNKYTLVIMCEMFIRRSKFLFLPLLIVAVLFCVLLPSRNSQNWQRYLIIKATTIPINWWVDRFGKCFLGQSYRKVMQHRFRGAVSPMRPWRLAGPWNSGHKMKSKKRRSTSWGLFDRPSCARMFATEPIASYEHTWNQRNPESLWGGSVQVTEAFQHG